MAAPGSAGQQFGATQPQAQDPAPSSQTVLDRMTAMFGDINTRLGKVETNLGDRIGKVESTIDKKVKLVSKKVGMVSRDLDYLKDNVGSLQKRVEENDKEMEKKIDQALEKRIKGSRINVPAGMRSRIRDMPLLP